MPPASSTFFCRPTLYHKWAVFVNRRPQIYSFHTMAKVGKSVVTSCQAAWLAVGIAGLGWWGYVGQPM